jgi:hypothetical protein
VGGKLSTPEALSERIKLIKAQKLLQLINAMKMDQCMIFVRTKVRGQQQGELL